MKPLISPNSRIRHPEDFVICEDSIVDDYCYFSTKVRIGIATHIASGCSIAGGRSFQFELGDFSSLSSGVKVWCTSDDFVNDVVTIIPQGVEQVKTHLISGDVIFGNYTAVGSNSVILPKNTIPEGVAIGALSLVPAAFEFQPWTVYAGVPARALRPRNRDSVMEQVDRLKVMLAIRDKRL
jgi:acetyltransferase-like isoleucine patch superfamily enzyme